MLIVMKRLTIILSCMLLLCACGGSKSSEPLDITGEWKLSDLTLTKSVQIGSEAVDIYISFAADKSFDLWQFLGAGRYEHFSGTWELSGDSLTGKYSDGSAWGNIYKVSVSGNELTMEATQESSDIYKYTRTTIPDSVK